MKLTAKKIVLFLPALILAAAFSTYAQGDLARGKWKLVEANGRAVANSSAFINFEPGAARFTGNTGCNTMNGSAETRGRNISLGRIATTKRMCKMTAGSVPEGEFLKALGDSVRYRADANDLRLFDRRGRRVLRFERVNGETSGSASVLAGRKWVLESIRNHRTFAPITGAFVRFDGDKNSVGGDSSCNVFGGNYTTRGRDSIRVTDVISTMRACVEDNKLSVERDMFAGLRAANRYELRDGRLFLYRDRTLELTFRADGGI